MAGMLIKFCTYVRRTPLSHYYTPSVVFSDGVYLAGKRYALITICGRVLVSARSLLPQLPHTDVGVMHYFQSDYLVSG